MHKKRVFLPLGDARPRPPRPQAAATAATLVAAVHTHVGDPRVVLDNVIVLESHLQAADTVAR